MAKKLVRKDKVSETLSNDGVVNQKQSPYVYQRDKIDFSLNIRELPWTEKQKEIIKLFLDKNTKMLILKGPAGTSKTLLGIYLGLHLLNDKKVSDMILVRSAVESSDAKLGYLPGSVDEKMSCYVTPFKDKLTELLKKNEVDKLEKDDRIVTCPINYLRGLHFAVKFICADELQNSTRKEIQTLLSRMGEFSKVMLCGDTEQIDLPYGKSGFQDVYDMFNDEESANMGIYCIELGEEDIVRSEFCKYVTNKFKKLNYKIESSKNLGGHTNGNGNGHQHDNRKNNTSVEWKPTPSSSMFPSG